MPKTRLTITIDKKVLEEFKKICEEMDVKMSTKINSLVRDWVNNNKEVIYENE